MNASSLLKTIALCVLWIVIGGVAIVIINAGWLFYPWPMTLTLMALCLAAGVGATALITRRGG
jgi:uncharacterized membrane protein